MFLSEGGQSLHPAGVQEEPQPAWPPQTADGVFATTQWTMIFDAARTGHEESSRALAKLCQAYWLPVYAFCRRRGHDPEEAKDLTQGFFANLLEKGGIGMADPEKGKFRTYLLGAVKFFLGNERQKKQRLKRGGSAEHLRIDAEHGERLLDAELSETQTPESLYERQWASVLLDRAQVALRQEYAEREKEALFETLSPFLGGSVGVECYAEAAQRHGQTEAAVKMAASRMRKRYGEILRELVAETVDSPEAVDEEIRHLLQVFRSW